MVEILLFYHPAVWWISRRVRAERELCCDDAAVAWCGDRLLYAEALVRLQEFRFERSSPAVAAGGGDLLFRIRRLHAPAPRPGVVPLRLNPLVLACSLAMVLGVGMSLNAMKAGSPEGSKWYLSGSNRTDYVLALDEETTRTGNPTWKLSCGVQEPAGFGTVRRDFSPGAFQGQRVRLSAWVKTQGAEGWAGLWMRVDGANHRILASKAGESAGFGTLMQMFQGKSYLGKRVRLSARVRTESVQRWAGLWMRVDGPDGKSVAFDNMGKRPLVGSLDWANYEVVLDMAPDSKALALGALLDGPGRVWMEEPRLEIVDESVPVTDLKRAR